MLILVSENLRNFQLHTRTAQRSSRIRAWGCCLFVCKGFSQVPHLQIVHSLTLPFYKPLLFWGLGERGIINVKAMKAKVFFSFMFFILCSLRVDAQRSREYIRNQIEEWGSCRNVAITMSGGDLALNWNNAYAYSGIPSGLANALDELNEKRKFIDDVQLTENGKWFILYGDNGCQWNDIPYSLESKLRELNNDGEVLTSVTFNDKGGWIVIGQEHIAASTPDVYDWIQEGLDAYGALWAAHMTNDGLVLCFERGYKFMGNVPDRLKNKLRSTNIDVYRIKFLPDGTYFIADKDGRFAYWM